MKREYYKINKLTYLLAAVVIALLVTLAVGLCYAADYSAKPSRIIANFGEDAAHTMMVTWQVDITADTQYIEYAYAADVDYTEKESKEAVSVDWELYDVTGVNNYSMRKVCRVIVDGLDAGTQYRYRVGEGSNWSDDQFFETASEESSDFSFLLFSDPQNTSNTTPYLEMQEAISLGMTDETDFVLIGGDISEVSGIEKHYESFFTNNKAVQSLPVVTIPGNHETLNYSNPATSYAEQPGENRAYNAHFFNPQNGPVFDGDYDIGVVNSTAAGKNSVNTTYYFYYERTLFIMLDTQQDSNNLKKVAGWCDDVLEYDRDENLSDYTIVMMHKGIFGNRYYGMTASLHEIFYKTFEDNNVDLVVSGHDHTWARTNPQNNGTDTLDEESGTVYVIMGSTGPKLYEPKAGSFEQFASAAQLNAGAYSNVTVNDTGIYVNAMMLNGEKLDEFFIPKKHNPEAFDISVTAGSTNAVLTASGNMNNIVSVEFLGAGGSKVAQLGRGGALCTVSGLIPDSVYELSAIITHTDGKKSVKHLQFETKNFINYNTADKTVSVASTAAEYDDCNIFINGSQKGKLVKDGTISFSGYPSGVYFIQLDLYLKDVLVDRSYYTLSL